MEEQKAFIIGYGPVNGGGVALHFNKPVRLKTGCGEYKSIWVSWDKIGRALVEDYDDNPTRQLPATPEKSG